MPIMIIRPMIIGSDDDGPLTKENIKALPLIRNYGTNDILAIVHDVEFSERNFQTARLDEFVDNDYYKVAYDMGYKTFASMNAKGEFNELVYFAKENDI